MFGRKNDLHKAHAGAHAKAQNALDVFGQIAADLNMAANQHAEVADAAALQIDELLDLQHSAIEASREANRRARAIRELVG